MYICKYACNFYYYYVSYKLLTSKCVVVIGKLSTLTKQEEVAAFENFRNSLNNIIIITFDELQERISQLISILSSDNG